jgi:hypothetical protein
MSWEIVVLILGIFWIIPFMYVIKWVFMSRMYKNASLKHQKEIESAMMDEQPTERFLAEG